MGSPMAEQNGGLRAVILAAIMLLALTPLGHVHAESEGVPENLQAQNIQAVFNSESETTLITWDNIATCLLYTSPSPRDDISSRMPSSA